MKCKSLADDDVPVERHLKPAYWTESVGKCPAGVSLFLYNKRTSCRNLAPLPPIPPKHWPYAFSPYRRFEKWQRKAGIPADLLDTPRKAGANAHFKKKKTTAIPPSFYVQLPSMRPHNHMMRDPPLLLSALLPPSSIPMPPSVIVDSALEKRLQVNAGNLERNWRRRGLCTVSVLLEGPRPTASCAYDQ